MAVRLAALGVGGPAAAAAAASRRSRSRSGAASVAGVRAGVRKGASTVVRAEPQNVNPSCSIEDMSECSLADLEMMYVESLWNYYNGGKKASFTLDDAQFDRLKDELNWQGSGFPTLTRTEIAFTNASIAWARGEKVLEDSEYEKLKDEVKASGKRADVTALLLCAKGQQLLEPEQYEALSEYMIELGVDVGLKGASCTLSKTSDDLDDNPDKVAQMYAGLSIFPTLICFAPSLLATGFVEVPPPIFAASAVAASALTLFIINYTQLNKARVLTGQCPCCESEVKNLFCSDEPADTAEVTCQVCGTRAVMDRPSMKLSLLQGPKFVST